LEKKKFAKEDSLSTFGKKSKERRIERYCRPLRRLEITFYTRLRALYSLIKERNPSFSVGLLMRKGPDRGDKAEGEFRLKKNQNRGNYLTVRSRHYGGKQKEGGSSTRPKGRKGHFS